MNEDSKIDSISGLWEKLSNAPTSFTAQSICCWTDLLGFGQPFYSSNWNPSKEDWKKITERIAAAHHKCYSNLDVITEFALTLNDGIVRCCDGDKFQSLLLFAHWLRCCIYTHNEINKTELSKKLPGSRTVLAAGPTLKYGHVDVRFDDFVFNYTKPDPGKLSTLAKQNGNPVVALNPGPLQMNLAFSKAYILEQGGSKFGLAGPHFFIDESVLSFACDLASKLNTQQYSVTDIRSATHRRFAFVNNKDATNCLFGFDLESPGIDVETSSIRTTVWRAAKFYVWDEPFDAFYVPIQ